MKKLISIIIPVYNDTHNLVKTINSLQCQFFVDFEIIIIATGISDTSMKLEIENIHKNSGLAGKCFFHKNQKMPGWSRNYGAQKAESSNIMFMDAGFSLDYNYLHDRLGEFEFIKKSKLPLCSLGMCVFKSESKIGKALVISTFGLSRQHKCLPGTIIDRCLYNKKFSLNENIRAGEDHQFFENLQNYYLPIEIPISKLKLVYNTFPTTFRSLFLKWMSYSKFGAKRLKKDLQTIVVGFLLLICFFLFFTQLKLAVILFLSYVLMRGFFIPLKRSDLSLFKFIHYYDINFLYLILVCLITDIGKFLGLLSRTLKSA